MNTSQLIRNGEEFSQGPFRTIASAPGRGMLLDGTGVMHNPTMTGNDLNRFIADYWDTVLVILENEGIVGWMTFDKSIHLIENISDEAFHFITGC